jgi:hypothetical protein
MKKIHFRLMSLALVISFKYESLALPSTIQLLRYRLAQEDCPHIRGRTDPRNPISSLAAGARSLQDWAIKLCQRLSLYGVRRACQRNLWTCLRSHRGSGKSAVFLAGF